VLDGYCINTESSEICIWLNDYKSIPTLVHELQHAMTFALYDRCFVDRREAELPAFYMEFLISEFLELSKNMENENK
jgi:oligoendopeptidase F